MRTLLTAAPLILALSEAVSARGSAYIHNQCNFDVYLKHISAVQVDKHATVLKAGSGMYDEKFRTCPQGGVSLKLYNSSEERFPTQFEYTYGTNMNFYDISNVDCHEADACPFQKYGMYIRPSSDCPVVNCDPSDDMAKKCTEVYNLFDDDHATHGCSPDTDLTMVLCSSASGASSGSSYGSEDSEEDSLDSGSGYIASPSSPSPSSSSRGHPSPYARPHKPKEDDVVAAADVSTSSPPSSTQAERPHPSTTLATHSKPAYKAKPEAKPSPSTTAPAQFNEEPAPVVAWETEWETVYSTVIVTARDASHEDHHRNKQRDPAPHPHARRHYQRNE